jgi:Ca2+-binding EF-hand superfamily protein
MQQDNDDEAENDKLRSEEQKMRLRLMQSAALVPRETPVRPLDRDNIDKLMSKYKSITEAADKSKEQHNYFKKKVMTQTMRMKLTAKFELAIKDAYKYRRQNLIQHKEDNYNVKHGSHTAKSPTGASRRESTQSPSAVAQQQAHAHAQAQAHQLHGHPEPVRHLDEKEREMVIKDGSIIGNLFEVGEGDNAAAAGATTHDSSRRSSVAPDGTPKSPGRIKLTTRQLLPYYTLEDVTNFMDTFSKVDEDFSGDLDIVEWVRLFNSMNHHISEHDARMIFMKLDKNGDGYLTMRELIPVIFSRASRAQQKLIIEVASFELIKKQDGIATMSLVEMEQLFEMYDTTHIGYVAVRAIRDHVNKMNLPDQALYMFIDTISHATEDEMVNLAEFVRLLKLYVEKSV